MAQVRVTIDPIPADGGFGGPMYAAAMRFKATSVAFRTRIASSRALGGHAAHLEAVGRPWIRGSSVVRHGARR